MLHDDRSAFGGSQTEPTAGRRPGVPRIDRHGALPREGLLDWRDPPPDRPLSPACLHAIARALANAHLAIRGPGEFAAGHTLRIAISWASGNHTVPEVQCTFLFDPSTGELEPDGP